MDLKIVVSIMLLAYVNVQGQIYEDRRCRCICPSPAAVLNISFIHRTIYTGNVPPNRCNCAGVILPLIGKDLQEQKHHFCPRCDCVYQTRNTTVIMVVVFAFLTSLAVLFAYWVMLRLLQYVVPAPRLEYRNLEDVDAMEIDEARLLLMEDPQE